MNEQYASRKIMRRCPRCDGLGEIEVAPFCSLCRQPVEPDWLGAGLNQMPCGHAAETYYQDLEACPTCHGSGRTEQVVAEEIWLRYRRRQLLRGTILLLVGLLPFLALAWVIWQSDIELICGNVWYGFLPLLWVRMSSRELSIRALHCGLIFDG